MPVTPTTVATTPAKYPSLQAGEVPFATYQTIRLLWDYSYTLQDRLKAAETTISSLTTLVNTLESTVTRLQRQTDNALAPTQQP